MFSSTMLVQSFCPIGYKVKTRTRYSLIYFSSKTLSLKKLLFGKILITMVSIIEFYWYVYFKVLFLV